MESFVEYFVVAVFGLCFGSFATVLAYRIPREIPIGLVSHTRSRCPHCNAVIPWFRNIPLVSWIAQRGRCANCAAAIPARYPLLEFTTAILFTVTYAVHRHSVLLPLEEFAVWAELIKNLYFTLSLVVVVAVDLEFRIIPDRFSIGNWVVAAGAALAWSSPPPLASLIGCLFGFGSFYLMAVLYERFAGQEGLGFGDVKMMGWIGAWLGISSVPFVILFASVTGLIVGLLAMRVSGEGMKTAIPFGPFLAAGAYIAWVLQSLDAMGTLALF